MSTPLAVMISSTARDLPDFREQVREACLRAEMLPKMMEHLPASDADAIEASLKMVDKADVYVGLFAHRYGYVPKGHDISITQMEYERAVERGIPSLVFIIDEDVAVLIKNVDEGEKKQKLNALKEHLKAKSVVGFFKNPDHLHSQVLHSLNQIRQQFREEAKEGAVSEAAVVRAQVQPGDLLPPLPEDIELPASPYRRLEYFEREDARVFFGRSREILELYNALTEPWTAPIVLFYGESGVGKSSLLAAGVQPRLEATHEIIYVRRDSTAGLTSTLARALEAEPAGIGAAWHAIEERRKRPLIVILDQLEELFTRPAEEADELGLFLKALDSLFAIRPKRPRGKLVLGFRKEWIADIEKRLAEALLPHDKVFLQRLTSSGIVEVVMGPQSSDRHRRRYRLTVEEDLPEMIASNLLKDLQSPVGPTLSILLHEMWERVKNGEKPAFTKTLYREYETKGLGDYLDEQLAKLDKNAIESGLVLDLLNYHTTDLGTAAARTLSSVYARYPGREEQVDALLEESQEKYLLVRGNQRGRAEEAVVRLAHDTLAPLVRQRFRESDRPAQRAERVLQSRLPDWKNGQRGTPLDGPGLKEVEKGQQGLRALEKDETRLVAASRQARTRRRSLQLSIAGVFAFVLGVAFLIYQDAQKYVVCDGAGNDVGWCRDCIDAGGTYDASGGDASLYCQNATFTGFNLKSDFVRIEAGTFPMGSDSTDPWRTSEEEWPRHTVVIEAPFYLGKYEVTQAQWYSVMGNNPSSLRGDSLPVTDVSWNDVQAFLGRLNELSECEGSCYRLPSEAEWEYAACMGEPTAFGFGNYVSELSEYAWYNENSGGRVRPVGQKRANERGLYDMHGNVWEWTQSAYQPYPYDAMDGRESSVSNEIRVLRGGSFNNTVFNVRCAGRVRDNPLNLNLDGGFRVVAPLVEPGNQ